MFRYYPCPCGWFGDPVHECTCFMTMVSRYQKRISGLLLDRIDMLCDMEVPRVEYEKLSDWTWICTDAKQHALTVAQLCVRMDLLTP